MEDLKTYLECGDGGCVTPANTMGMGNPGETAPDTLSEPIGGIEKTAKVLKQNDRKKKKKIKSLSESIFDKDLATRDMSTFGSIFELSRVEIKEDILRPNPRGLGMINTNLKVGDLYKTSLLSKDAGIRVTKDPNTIADALDKIVRDTKITPEFFKMSFYDFGKMLHEENYKYYSNNIRTNSYLRMVADVHVIGDEGSNQSSLVLDSDIIYVKFFHIALKYKRK